MEVAWPHPDPPGDDGSRTGPVKSAYGVPSGRLLTEPAQLLGLAAYRVGVRTGRPHQGGRRGQLTSSKTQTGKGIVELVIFLAASWLMLLTTLVVDFAGIRRRGTAWRWQGTGLLIMNSVVLVDSYADARGGPYPRTPLHSFTWPVLLTGFALLVIGLVVQVRERRGARVS